MPNKPKRQIVATTEVTSADVADLWSRATKKGPYPDSEANHLIAKVLNNYRANPDFNVDSGPLNAIDLLLKFCVESYHEDNGFKGRDYQLDALEGALRRARPSVKALFDGQKAGRKFDEVAAFIIWCAAGAVLEDLGRNTGSSRDSVAVQFTALALHRLGWTNTGLGGLEVMIRRWEATKGIGAGPT